MKRLLLALAALAMMTLPAPAQDFPVRRCMNLGDALDTPKVEGEWGYIIQTRDLDAVRKAGFDTVRLPVRFSSRWDGDAINPTFLRHVDVLIKAALTRKLNVILDLHHFTELMAEPEANKAAFLGIWAELAAHYAGWPDGLMFELLNEPEDRLTTADALGLYGAVVPMIRRLHPDRWVIVGGGGANSLSEMLTLPQGDAHMVATFHYYEPFAFTHQLADWVTPVLPARSWGTAQDRAEVAADMARAASHPGPVFLGEFGAIALIPDAVRADWLAEVRRAAEANGLGWCHWSFATTFAAYDLKGKSWNRKILAALTK
ncbi:MAG: glycoside hydrolase family 5 protein [Pseudorhodobacter sp.]|nr:glycoside hydrolase family 5 protein [Pseudorhodobacter sp.]